MSAIDITTMRGEMPRTVPHLLPEQAATVAKNCHFRHGVITPIMADVDGGKTFKLKPTTIFRYRDDYWFAWTDLVDAIRSPVAQDKYERVYFTDGKYPKVTSNEIATQGLITTLVKRKSIPILAIPRGSGQNKLIRCLNTIPQMKTGCVYLPALMTDDGQKIPQVYYWDGAVAASTDWVMPALTECADFSADDSHKNDDILDTMMDSIEIELIAGGSISYDKWV